MLYNLCLSYFYDRFGANVCFYVSLSWFPFNEIFLFKFTWSKNIPHLSFKVYVQKMLQKIQGRIAIDRFEEIFKKYLFLVELLEKYDFWDHNCLIWSKNIPNRSILEPN